MPSKKPVKLGENAPSPERRNQGKTPPSKPSPKKALASGGSTPTPDRVELHGGLGTMHSTGALIGMFLELAGTHSRISILTDVIRKVGVTPEELADHYYAIQCGWCGMLDSQMHPCECEPRVKPTRAALAKARGESDAG